MAADHKAVLGRPETDRFCHVIPVSGVVPRFKRVVKKMVSVAVEIALNPSGLVRFVRDRRNFRRSGGLVTNFWPILRDFHDKAGTARGHYFHQDLLVASFIFERSPKRHIDIGSRIDGFVAHVAAFREIEIVDVRPVESSQHHQISFLQRDMMVEDAQNSDVADSISCLHAIEHFGLGRYGEPLDAEGHIRGFLNIVKMLKVGGYFYLSFPIGITNEVHFNAHRVFHPTDVLSWPGSAGVLELERFDYVDDAGDLHLEADLSTSVPVLRYGCGIYTFRKVA